MERVREKNREMKHPRSKKEQERVIRPRKRRKKNVISIPLLDLPVEMFMEICYYLNYRDFILFTIVLEYFNRLDVTRILNNDNYGISYINEIFKYKNNLKTTTFISTLIKELIIYDKLALLKHLFKQPYSSKNYTLKEYHEILLCIFREEENSNNRLEIIKLLVEYMNSINLYREIATGAIITEDMDIIKWLISNYSISYDQMLFLVIDKNSMPCLRKLIHYNKEQFANVYMTALERIILRGNVTMVKEILQDESVPENMNKISKAFALERAAQHNKFYIVKVLLKDYKYKDEILKDVILNLTERSLFPPIIGERGVRRQIAHSILDKLKP